MTTPYSEKFRVNESVRIKDRSTLERFAKEWTLHHRLVPEQLPYAGTVTRVTEVSFYHGGDPLYELCDVPGTWHEACLEPA